MDLTPDENIKNESNVLCFFEGCIIHSIEQLNKETTPLKKLPHAKNIELSLNKIFTLYGIEHTEDVIKKYKLDLEYGFNLTRRPF